MGLFTSILSLLSCGHGNKRVTQNDGINSNIPVAARITIDKLPDVLRNVQAGNTDYDFIGICSNGVDCIYFVSYPDIGRHIYKLINVLLL